MFKKDYQESLQNITPDKYIKQKIKSRLSYEEKLIEIKETERAKRNPAVYWRLGFTAVVCCIAIVFGTVFILKPPADTEKTKKPAVQATANDGLIVSASSYEEIYELLKANKILSGGSKFESSAGTGTGTSAGTSSGTALDEFTADLTGNNDSVEEGVDITNESENYSTTNTQVANVDEADIVKTDGKYIYTSYKDIFCIISAEEMSVVSKTDLKSQYYKDNSQMYIYENRAILIRSSTNTQIYTLDISDKTKPKIIQKTTQDGVYKSSRMIDGVLYTLTNCFINIYNASVDEPDTYIPSVYDGEEYKLCSYKDIYRQKGNDYEQSSFLTACSYSAVNGDLKSFISVLGSVNNMYCDTENIITAKTNYNYSYSNSTTVSRFTLKNGKIQYKTSAVIDGALLNQFSIDRYKDNFRFVTTVTSNTTSASLFILNEDLNKIGEISSLAEGESVYSVRFMGDMAYFVTFRQTDPLFSADLSDPTNPKIIGYLKIPGFSNYLHPYNNKLLGIGMNASPYTGITQGVKLSMFNITDPANVTEENNIIFKEFDHCTVSDDHRAALINAEKNIIGFYCYDSHNKDGYYIICSYNENGFNVDAKLLIHDYVYDADTRAVYIGNRLYITDGENFYIYDMNDYSLIKTFECW